MVDESAKKGKKVPISEEDAATILHRYSPEMILAVLQEVSQNVGEKIDWYALVKNTNTAITSAKEYQMLWRHLAYGQTLIDQLDDAESPLGDDSDLEIDRESFPPVSREVSAEAAACVKVLMASGSTNDLDVSSNSTIEAPLTINIPNIRVLTAPSDSSLHAHAVQSMNIVIPVFVQKQPLSSGTTGEKRPISEPAGVNVTPQRKRKGWSTGEDNKLTAAIQKHGEQFANIASGDFKNDRKATELSQRWTNLKKKQGTSNTGSSSQPSEMQVAATNRSISAALDRPKSASHYVGMKLSHQPQKTSTSLGTAGPPKCQLPAERPLFNPTPVPDPMIKAAAIAAGARIATSADAASLMEAARSQNVVHIKIGGASGMKSPSTSIASQLSTKMHLVHEGLAKAKAPISAHPAPKLNVARPSEAQKSQGNPIRTGAIQVKTADGPVKPLGQSDRGADDADLSKCTPPGKKDQSPKLGN